MRYPAIRHPRRIVRSLDHVAAQYPDGGYGPARDLPFDPGFPWCIPSRLRIAWRVFTGRYDALDWEEE